MNVEAKESSKGKMKVERAGHGIESRGWVGTGTREHLPGRSRDLSALKARRACLQYGTVQSG